MSRLPFSRAQRVGELVQHELGMYFIAGQAKDERIRDQQITVTYVKMSHDLKHATVYFRILGSESVSEECLKALNESAYVIKKQIAHKCALRYTPTMVFELDQHYLESQRLYNLIETINKSSHETPENSGGTNA